MNNSYQEIKQRLEKDLKVKVRYKEKSLFPDITIELNGVRKGMVISYVMSHYSEFLKLRVNDDNTLIYTYLVVSEKKLKRIKEDLTNHKRRFKWLYAQIRDEEIFIKNAKIIKEDKENGS